VCEAACVSVAAILLGSVKVPYDEIRRRIVEVDEENLTAGLMEQLIKYMPSHDQVTQLAALKSQYADLAEPEQFVVVVHTVYVNKSNRNHNNHNQQFI